MGERSLHLTPPTYSPSLVFPRGKNYKKQTFCTLTDGGYHHRSIPEMRGKSCIASCFGWLIMTTYTTTPTQCCLFNPCSLTTIYLPPLKRPAYTTGLITSPPADDNPNCVVMLFSRIYKSFIRCQVGDDEWIEKDLQPKKELKEIKLWRVLPVLCRGKVYLFLNGNMMILIDPRGYFPTNILHQWKEPQSSWVNAVGYYFVESCGDIFQVLAHFLGFSTDITQTFDVYRFNSSTLIDWTKVESLGDRVFLLSAWTCTSFSSTELGMKGNCIYLSVRKSTYLNKFDMEEGTLTTTTPCPQNFSQWDEPFWMVPDCNLHPKAKPNVGNFEVAKHEDTENWKDLMPEPELLNLVMSGLFLDDCIRLRLACKALMAITPPVRPYATVLTQRPYLRCQKLPWLLSVPKYNKGGKCQFHHSIYTDSYVMNAPEFEGAVVRHAKDGWLLMSQGESSIFFFNPVSLETIKIPPETEYGLGFVNLSFSSPPTCSDCVVVGHTTYLTPMYACICVYRIGEDAWTEHMIRQKGFEDGWKESLFREKGFLPSFCSPVFCGGVFYSLGKDGKLGIINPRETEEESMWKLLPNVIVPEAMPKQVHGLPRLYPLDHSSVRSFLMEYSGEIYSVFVGLWSKFVRVFRYDQSEMQWVRLQSLGNKVMFVSCTASILVRAQVKGIQNRIYFPRFHGKDNIFYSLSTGKYHYFGGKTCGADWINTSENMNCTWFQSSLSNATPTLQIGDLDTET